MPLRSTVKLIIFAAVGLSAACLIFGGTLRRAPSLSNYSPEQESSGTRVLNSPLNWLVYDGPNYSFAYPPLWIVTSTAYGATAVQSGADARSEPGGNTELLILRLGSIFDCSQTQPCFANLHGLAANLGYVTTTPLLIGGEPSLKTVTETDITKYIVQADREGYLITVQSNRSGDIDIVSALLSSLRFH